jgi:DNA-binding transcriptional LysR family regulator
VELRELLAFQLIIEVGSFRLAAERLNLTASALSHQIARLERDLSQPLLVRTNSAVYPTALGKVLFESAKRINLEAANVRERFVLGLSERQKGRVRVAATNVGLSYIYGDLCERFIASYPHIELVITATETTDAASQRVADGAADLAFTTLPLSAQSLDTTMIGRSEQVFIVGRDHALAKRKKVSLDEVRRFKFVRFLPGSGARILSDRLFRPGKYPPIITETNDVEVVKRIAKLSLAVCLVPVFTIVREVGLSELFPLRLSTGRVMQDFGVAYRKKETNISLKLFRDFCLQQNNRKAMILRLENVDGNR